jgi:hypothetical protein
MKPLRRKNQQRVVGGWGNSSSKAFGVSNADRPKAKVDCIDAASIVIVLFFLLFFTVLAQRSSSSPFSTTASLRG